MKKIKFIVTAVIAAVICFQIWEVRKNRSMLPYPQFWEAEELRVLWLSQSFGLPQCRRCRYRHFISGMYRNGMRNRDTVPHRYSLIGKCRTRKHRSRNQSRCYYTANSVPSELLFICLPSLDFSPNNLSNLP